VTGGSARYIDALVAPLGSRVSTGTGATAIQRDPAEVQIWLDDGTSITADHVVIAPHADAALQLLVDATPAEKDVLGTWRYSTNAAILHTDDRMLPRRRAVRASWNYRLTDCEAPHEHVSLSY